ncbi:MAG TPA: ribonuclease BN, partial [Balneola sp.]|nr:ribonuclease BN [Balneola sp.]
EDEVARQTLLSQFETLFGMESAEAINKILTNVSEASNSILAQVLGFITLIVSATTVFVSLQDGINQVWGL